MSGADGSMDEMRIQHEFERALAREGTPSALTALVDDLRSLADTAVSEPVARRHIAAAAMAAREGDERAAVVVPFHRERRQRRVGALARTAMAAAAGVALVLSLASAGFLPTPVQAAVADIAEWVGLHLPDPDRTEGGEPPADRTPAPADEPGSGIEDVPGAPGLPPTPAPPVAPGAPPAVVPDPAPATSASPSIPPLGSPTETPSGPPAGTPSGAPDGTPSGPPEGTPSPLGGSPGP